MIYVFCKKVLGFEIYISHLSLSCDFIKILHYGQTPFLLELPLILKLNISERDESSSIHFPLTADNFILLLLFFIIKYFWLISNLILMWSSVSYTGHSTFPLVFPPHCHQSSCFKMQISSLPCSNQFQLLPILHGVKLQGPNRTQDHPSRLFLPELQPHSGLFSVSSWNWTLLEASQPLHVAMFDKPLRLALTTRCCKNKIFEK